LIFKGISTTWGNNPQPYGSAEGNHEWTDLKSEGRRPKSEGGTALTRIDTNFHGFSDRSPFSAFPLSDSLTFDRSPPPSATISDPQPSILAFRRPVKCALFGAGRPMPPTCSRQMKMGKSW